LNQLMRMVILALVLGVPASSSMAETTPSKTAKEFIASMIKVVEVKPENITYRDQARQPISEAAFMRALEIDAAYFLTSQWSNQKGAVTTMVLTLGEDKK